MAQKQIVAYLGPRSSYSHQAALDCFDPEAFEFHPQVTIADIFSAVQTRSTTYGVVPFENSTNGSVVFTLDLFCDRDGLFSDVQVVSEAYLDVHHCLLGLPRPAPLSPANVTKIYSHPQAFGQCEKFLTKHLKGVERVDVSSTSKAAEIVKREPGAVAIASRIASEVHGLDILAPNIEDSPDNTTRFLVLSTGEAQESNYDGGERRDKTLIGFTIDHARPGALCDSLRVFKDHGLNLTSIASRPSRVTPWNYIFFVEFSGHKEEDGVKKAVKEMADYCLGYRVWGSFRDRQKR
ncbi:PDT-domain-containing protein [Terfezia boudieri ATCC MYA-4762]|uniref:prephenate dehydratase n=1 Tax=Terfezia boudieri ATCC MYA-4762 TaxID=1051890 RepID=A0A3N4LRW7_9PEZI|nr:PDT-domain-containing protein [Terfezia boudieri ATCC MYA-4762]